MNKEQLKKLEADLWRAADSLRANSDLKASEYSTPVLGLTRDALLPRLISGKLAVDGLDIKTVPK